MDTGRERKECELHNCEIKLRANPQRRKDKVRIGCGAGFAGDRPLAALKLLRRVEGLDYLVLECLAERTLADRYQIMTEGGDGYDPRISEWMSLLLPLCMEKGVCIVTNMGAMDSRGAQRAVLDVAKNLGFHVVVALAYEVGQSESGIQLVDENCEVIKGAVSTYMGAAPIVECLEKYKPHIIITSRVADIALFLGPMVFELGWNWNDLQLLAQGSLAGHLLECGCQLTGGYFMHPGDKNRNLSISQLLDLSLPYADIYSDGEVFVAKAEGSGGMLNHSTCAEQLLYEVGDPGSYVTPDVVVDFQDVKFHSLSDDKVHVSGAKACNNLVPNKLLQLVPKVCGWKGWGEISYGGSECVKRAEIAKILVSSWIEEAFPGTRDCIVSYIIGMDSLKAVDINDDILCLRDTVDVRLRMDGLFELREHAISFVREFMALYTNGPAGGGGISTGHKKEIMLMKQLVERETVVWSTEATASSVVSPSGGNIVMKFPSIAAQESSHAPENTFLKSGGGNPDPTTVIVMKFPSIAAQESSHAPENTFLKSGGGNPDPTTANLGRDPSPAGKKIPLYEVAHSRAGDKGNDLNFSIIPHFPPDILRLKKIMTPEWVIRVLSRLIDMSSFLNPLATQQRNKWLSENVSVEIYEARGIHSLNFVVRNILDGGVNCSRRIDRHGKTISDLILRQKVVLPPP